MNPAEPMFAPATSETPPRVLVVAELGVNHDGKLETALRLVDAAAEAFGGLPGAVKLQLFDPRRLLSNQARLAQYQGEAAESDPFAMLDRLKLDAAAMLAVRDRARQRGLHFIVTPFSLEDVETLRMLDVDAVKIASPDAVNTPLLDAVAALGKPMLISTGTCTLDELDHAASLVRRTCGCLLQCVSSYPTGDADASVGGVRALIDHFRVPVGYSDHTTNMLTGAIAVAAGACVIEKHLTYNRGAAGPDHAASLDPRDFVDYLYRILKATWLLGPTAKRVLECEEDVRTVSRQSVCATRDLPAGAVLQPGDLTVKRPGTGIPAAALPTTIGRTLARAVRANDLLQPDDLR